MLEDVVRMFGPQSTEMVLNWAEQICEVLQYLQNLNPPRIFRDMRPGNILLRADGSLMLIDFEIMGKYDPHKTRDTQNIRTCGYEPPEQYVPAQTYASSDIYALGMTLHYLLTEDNPQKIPYAAWIVRETNYGRQKNLKGIISKCIQLYPQKRYQSCQDLAKDLERVYTQKGCSSF